MERLGVMKDAGYDKAWELARVTFRKKYSKLAFISLMKEDAVFIEQFHLIRPDDADGPRVYFRDTEGVDDTDQETSQKEDPG